MSMSARPRQILPVMLSFSLYVVALLLTILVAATQAWSQTTTPPKAKTQENRVALVVGISAYPASALENPLHDATAIYAALKRLGFETEIALDSTKVQLDAALRRFGNRAEKAEVAALFYAGHGIQVNGTNYLVPIDAKPQSERDLKRDMIRLDDIIEDMGQARIKLVFFDACRDNPLARSFSRGAARGLAAPTEASGTLISFATKHGNFAADGEGKNSPYSQALLAELANPAGVEIEILIKNVSRAVKQKTRGQQEPWKYGSLDADFYFIFDGPGTVNVQQVMADPETETWKAAESGNTEEAYQAYLDAYPKGRYIVAAKIKMMGLKSIRPGAVSAAPTIPPIASHHSANKAEVGARKKNPEDKKIEIQRIAGTVFQDCNDCPEMVVIPAGSFDMGSLASEAGRVSDEDPRRIVQIAQPFALGRSEVTQQQWRDVMGSDPADLENAGCDNCPVGNVNWKETQEFLRKLSKKTGQTYRLPSEAEWEYACRAGGAHRFCGSDDIDSVAWYVLNSNGGAQQVADKLANAWGLFDMSGNLWEWTEDCWNPNYMGAPSDGSPWMRGDCNIHVMRGGSWRNQPQYARSAGRGWGTWLDRFGFLGFRCVRTLQ